MNPWAMLGMALAAPPASSTNPVLVLLPPYAAGPVLEPTAYVHDCVIRWPGAVGANGNQLLSLLTGIDWVGDSRDYAFRRVRQGQWVAEHTLELKDRGYFAAKDAALGMPTAAISDGVRFAPSVLLAAVEGGGLVKSYSLKEPWPSATLMVFGAHDWAEVDAISARTSGRVAIVEYPPPANQRISRLWLRGDWPPGRVDLAEERRPALPVFSEFETAELPGLVPARKVGQLLVHPHRETWVADPGPAWEGAGPWLRSVEASGPLLRAVLAAVWGVLLIFAMRMIGDERRHRWIAYGLAMTGIVPLLVMSASRFQWVSGWSALLWATPAMAAIFGVAVGLLRLLKASWISSAGMVAAVLMLMALPNLSPLSGPLGTMPLPSSPEALALLYAGMTLAVAESGVPLIFGAAIVISAWIAGMLRSGWFAPEGGLLAWMPFACLLAGRKRLRAWHGVVAWIATDGLAAMLTVGIAYHQRGLVTNAKSWGALDLADGVRFFLSLEFLIPAFMLVLLAIWTPSFAMHQMRKVWAASPSLRAMGQLTMFLAVLGPFQSGMLWVAWVAGLATVTLWAMEALWFSPALT